MKNFSQRPRHGADNLSTAIARHAAGRNYSIHHPQSTIFDLSCHDGNMISGPLPADVDSASDLTWDAENRLIETTVGTSGPLVRYHYDSQSRRISTTTGGNTTICVYDGWNPIAEYSIQNSTFAIQNSFTWGTDLSGSLQGAGGVGGLLAVTEHDGSSSESFFPTYDGNGNISEYLDDEGAVAAHYEYDPFGKETVINGTKADDFAHRFSTKQLDFVTGLLYYGYRWMDPATGRWPSRDPIEEEGGLNLYGFVGNNGVNWWDRLGLENKCPDGQCCESGGCVEKVTIHVINRSGGRRTGAAGGHIDLGIPGVGMVGFFGVPNGGSDESTERSSNKPLGVDYDGYLNDSYDEWTDPQTGRPDYVNGRVLSTICEVKVCRSAVEAMKKRIQEINQNPGKFKIAGGNCSTKGCSILGSGGVTDGKIDGIDNPQGLLDQLQENEGARCYNGYTFLNEDNEFSAREAGPAPARPSGGSSRPSGPPHRR